MAMGFGVRLEVLVGVDFLGFQVLGLGPLLALLSVGEVVLLARLLPLLLLLQNRGLLLRLLPLLSLR